MSPETMTHLLPHLWIQQSQLYHTNSGILISGAEACLIDPGITPDEIESIAHFVREQGLTVKTLILTHAHWDHILGVDAFPGALVIAHAEYPRVVKTHGEHLSRQVSQWAEKAGIGGLSYFTPPKATITFTHTLNQIINDLTLRLINAPGHAPAQCVVYDAESGMLWAADMLSDLEIPFVSHSLEAYEDTLARLAELEVKALIPGHGNPTTDHNEIKRRFTEDREYLAALRAGVTKALADELTIAEAVEACADIAVHHPEDNAGGHRLNVETVYLELGGEATPGHMGWNKEWTEEA
ncbi:MAG: MBL fold metallo-hydrolase [Anaerolineae bacterium]|nr:MBL fold metallo-hydrolase [Anaerolineae bacterium]